MIDQSINQSTRVSTSRSHLQRCWEVPPPASMVATQCTWWLPDGTQSHGIMSSLFTSCHKYQQWKEWYHYYSATIRWRSLLLRQQRRDSWLTTSYHSQLTMWWHGYTMTKLPCHHHTPLILT